MLEKIRKQISTALLAAGCFSLLLSGCIKEDVASLSGEQHDVTVLLNVGTRAVEDADGTPTDTEKALHSLRVYAFVGGKLVGHHYTDKTTQEGLSFPASFLMDLKLYTGKQDVEFYVVANEGAMYNPSISLSKTTTKAQLNGLWFTNYEVVSK